MSDDDASASGSDSDGNESDRPVKKRGADQDTGLFEKKGVPLYDQQM